MFLREELCEDTQYKVLTHREMEVLQCIWDGLETRAIGEKLSMSRKGVEFHRQNLVKKWRCENVMQAVRLALRRRLLDV